MSDSPEGHPSPELLAAYASGWLPASADLCLEVHVDGCPTCRDALAVLHAKEEAFIDSLPAAPLSAEGMAGLLAKIEATAVEPAPTREARVLGDVPLPPALGAYAMGARRWLRPGLWVSHLRMPKHDDWRTYVLRAPAGQGLPPHGHRGPELVCVLMGAFHDDRDYRAGDFVEASRLKHHRLTVTPDGPCACLIATKGPLVMRGGARAIGTTLSI